MTGVHCTACRITEGEASDGTDGQRKSGDPAHADNTGAARPEPMRLLQEAFKQLDPPVQQAVGLLDRKAKIENQLATLGVAVTAEAEEFRK